MIGSCLRCSSTWADVIALEISSRVDLYPRHRHLPLQYVARYAKRSKIIAAAIKSSRIRTKHMWAPIPSDTEGLLLLRTFDPASPAPDLATHHPLRPKELINQECHILRHCRDSACRSEQGFEGWIDSDSSAGSSSDIGIERWNPRTYRHPNIAHFETPHLILTSIYHSGEIAAHFEH